MANQKPMLSYQELSYSYRSKAGEIPVFSNFSLDVMEGEFLAILGPSGCGKSTLLSIAAGLLTADEGAVILGGEPVTGPSPKVGYMLQRDHLFEWRDILQNGLLGLHVQKRATKEAEENVKGLLHRCGLGDFMHAFPQQLSGGMRQRAALVRTLATDPAVLLLDEPFSALDAQTRLNMSEEMAVVLREQKKTAVLVTHDVSEAVAMADRVCVLTCRPTQLKAEYTIDIPGTPLGRRGHPDFRGYFDKLWKELDAHVS